MNQPACPASTISDTQLAGQSGEARIGRPYLQSPYNSGRQEMNVDPAHAAAVQVAIANEPGNVPVRNHGGLMDPLVGGQEVSRGLLDRR